MATIKISELEELNKSNDDDLLVIVDSVENETKKIKKENLKIPNINNSKNDSTTDTYSCDYVNKLNTYSTEEKVIGTWIDGKPLYRKVVPVVISNITDTTISNIKIAHNIANMKFGFVEMATKDISTGDTYSYGSSGYINATNNRTQWFLNKTEISASTNRSADNGTWYVSICYTKTTD